MTFYLFSKSVKIRAQETFKYVRMFVLLEKSRDGSHVMQGDT